MVSGNLYSFEVIGIVGLSPTLVRDIMHSNVRLVPTAVFRFNDLVLATKCDTNGVCILLEVLVLGYMRFL